MKDHDYDKLISSILNIPTSDIESLNVSNDEAQTTIYLTQKNMISFNVPTVPQLITSPTASTAGKSLSTMTSSFMKSFFSMSEDIAALLVADHSPTKPVSSRIKRRLPIRWSTESWNS
ncbi:MAG: hypothetical protein IKE59_02345 [Erysipelotrichaceae bacterium]|nr:hypothetical protein [Erysipelotrichaceae bacterium]